MTCKTRQVTTHACGPAQQASKFEGCPSAWFDQMIENCLRFARQQKDLGRPIVGITCEYTPRELIMAAGAIPVCLCGGSAEMIGPAEEHLPVGLCPLIKSTYGFHLKKANPFLEMADLLVVETTCDGKKKMYELMGLRRRMHVIELPQKPDDPDAMAHWLSQLQVLKDRLEGEFGVRIKDSDLRNAISLMNQERSYRRQLASLMQEQPPPMTGRQLLQFKSIISCIPEDLDQYRKAIEILNSKPIATGLESRVRVLMTGVPTVHGAERVIEIIESHGGVVVCMDNCTGLKPIYEDVDPDAPDPMRAIAEKYLHIPCSVMTPNNRRLELMERWARQFKAECIIELIWQGCLTYDVEAYFVKGLAERLGLPYLRIQTDYSPSDSARIALRIEALFETVRQRAAASG